jgi:transcriptional regulator with XRE-family HTH domain
MSKKILPDLAIALTFLREGQGWSQTELAEAAGTTPKLISDYEAGRKRLLRERLEYLTGFMDIPPERIDATLSCLRGNQSSSRPPLNPGDAFAGSRRRIEAAAAKSARLSEEFVRSQLMLLTVEGEGLQARQQAEFLWNRLKKRNPKERRLMVKDDPDLQSWALSERAAAESIHLAPNHPQDALEAARLAQDIAKKVSGDALWRKRVEGYALAHVSNGLRVCNDLPAMGTTINHARKLWEEGEAGDPGLLNPAVVPWIEAAVRKDQREFAEALKRVDEALRLDQGELRGKMLITKAAVLNALGDSERVTAVLFEAARLIDGRKDPRLAFYLKCDLLWNLCHRGKAAEAEPELEEVSQLGERLGEKLNLTRVAWLRGMVEAGLGQYGKAEAALRQVRREFEAHNLVYDYALVSLDLSLVLLKWNRHQEVKRIAEEMVVIFRRFDIGREAGMAIRIFCEAACQEAATIDMAARLLRFLRQAQHNPDLKFDEAMGAEAG